MHEITFAPMRMDAPVTASIAGDMLRINGADFNLITPEGCPWISGRPERMDGGWRLTMILPHGGDAPRETRFPEVLLMEGDGTIRLPPFDILPMMEGRDD